jgi:hypothetical protein
MTVSAPLVKASLKTTAETLWASDDVLVTYGAPGTYQPDDIVGILDQRFEIERPTMGNRSREEVVETAVTFSIFRHGGEEAQQIATERAYALAAQLDEYIRAKPNETLGGSCRDAWVSGGELVETKVLPRQKSDVVAGRAAELTVTVTSRHRRT